jgi:D-beta-D-heptose 7-phosphate kinase/D-beta-D-heptose 1-phosphate adenosyltransferase
MLWFSFLRGVIVSKSDVIFTNGCFDILHLGHIELLKFCKDLGNVIVGLNSDSSIRKLKGKSRPIFSQYERKALLESIKFVDQVVIFDEETPYRLIQEIRPTFIVKGGDYKHSEVIGSDIAPVKIFDYLEGHSTSLAIDKILSGRESDYGILRGQN